ncbi:unnamed protein product [Ceutorhynchus assimilis]|uniref:Uncharacterized protein n=1 Tax=Ceutorhynchus assimilis TaxID=467358 RepID=A0A9N9QC93_9CUCU|nr:unnamed protein product [Ceutorhynchus assimilis]
MSSYFGDRTVFINHEKCFKFEVIDNKIARTVEEDLSCSEHLEADSKISFHVCQLNLDAYVTIRCSDTDIIIVIMLDVVSCFAAHNYIISSIDYGWQEEDGKYIFKWFDGEQLPDLQDITDDLSTNLTDCQEDADGDEESSDYDNESFTEESDTQSDSETD